jgi:hypothetical protein
MKHSRLPITYLAVLIAFLPCSPIEAARKSKADKEREAQWQAMKDKAEANRQASEKTTYKSTSAETRQEASRQAISPVDDGSSTKTGNRNVEATIGLKQLADWMKENNPTPAQSKAYNSYKQARETYDAFVAKSAEMVQAMDKSSGPKREDLLNKLRLRKNAEQPIAEELKKAHDQLLAAFSEVIKDLQKK